MRKGFNPLDPRDIFPEITNNTEDSNNYTGINSCYVGYQCEIDQETQSVEIDGMDFSYSGDRENEEYATIAHSNKDVDVWLVSYGVSSGEVTLTYGEVMSSSSTTTSTTRSSFSPDKSGMTSMQTIPSTEICDEHEIFTL